MYIWRLKVDGDDEEYFSTWELVVQWLTLFKDDHNAELIMLESVYVNED